MILVTNQGKMNNDINFFKADIEQPLNLICLFERKVVQRLTFYLSNGSRIKHVKLRVQMQNKFNFVINNSIYRTYYLNHI